MSQDPERWKDATDSPARVRDLLRETSALGPMPEDIHAAILAGLPGGPPAAGTPPASNAPTAAGTATKGVLGSAAVPVAVGGGALALAAIVAVLAWSDRPATQPSTPAVASASSPALEAPTDEPQ